MSPSLEPSATNAVKRGFTIERLPMTTELILAGCAVVSAVISVCFFRALRKVNAFLDWVRASRAAAPERDRGHELCRRQWARVKARHEFPRITHNTKRAGAARRS